MRQGEQGHLTLPEAEAEGEGEDKYKEEVR